MANTWHWSAIVASMPGYGPAWIQCRDIPSGQQPMLRLASDVALEGRIVDLEGRPVPGHVSSWSCLARMGQTI